MEVASGSCNLPSREALLVKTSKPNFVTFLVYFGKSLFDYGGTGGESVNSTGHSLIEQSIRAREKHYPLF